jgi:hypothetical protein
MKVRKFQQEEIPAVDRIFPRIVQSIFDVLVAQMKVTAPMEIWPPIESGLEIANPLSDHLWLKGVPGIGVGGCNDFGCAGFIRDFQHRQAGFTAIRSIIQAPKNVAVNIDHFSKYTNPPAQGYHRDRIAQPNTTLPQRDWKTSQKFSPQESAAPGDKGSMDPGYSNRLVILLAFMPCPFLHAQQTGSYQPPLTIAIVNKSAVVADQDVAQWAAAIARQVHEDLAPAWKIDANVVFQQDPPAGAWVCTIEDSDVGSVTTGVPMGTHAVLKDGTPGCSVNAGMIVTYQLGSVSMPLSHEILEMLVDPWLSNVTFLPASTPTSATVYLREICDPVAGYGYEIDGVTVSDFSHPEFWTPGFPAPGTKYDRLGIATIALSPTAHSYMLVRFIRDYGGISSLESWTYIWGSYCVFGPC